MTIQVIKQAFAMMGATLTISGTEATVAFKGITIQVSLTMPEGELQAALYFLNISMPDWLKQIKQALAEEKEARNHETT